ncbi:hypothetical protein [Hanstruepera marina]|uniref:hypothetical protein n=1 Tax=Hanstruepera marina TaxID=2873265 RepID=UPI001CA69E39|nr:hypothetical protein [Hanstruepera marina]
MKNLVLTYCLIIFSGLFALHAQITDSNNSSLSIPAESNSKGENNSTSFDINPIYNSGLTKPKSNTVNGMSVPNSSSNSNSEFSMFEKEEYGDPGEIYERRMAKVSKELEKRPDESVSGKTTDQYLGDFKTKSRSVTVAYRDYGGVDGDRIRVFVEGDVVKSNVLLGGTFSSFKLDLVTGFNKIDFKALNQGEVGPNTAELLVLDEDGNILASEYWALATGVKATIILVKE